MMAEALPLYRELIEKTGAQIVGTASEETLPDIHGELEAEAKRRFGDVRMIYIEFWHDGGCSSKGLSKQAVTEAMSADGWIEEVRQLDDPSDIDLNKKGPKSGKWFTLFHAETEEPGFHLLAPPVFLPESTADEDAVAKGTSYLRSVLEDLAAMRASVPGILTARCGAVRG